MSLLWPEGMRVRSAAVNASCSQTANKKALAGVLFTRNLKQTGIGRFPSRDLPINQTWLQLALTAADLVPWTQTTLLTNDLAKAEPKMLRYRLLHVAARLIRGQRRTR